jgi:molecular chaperone GrpE
MEAADKNRNRPNDGERTDAEAAAEVDRLKAELQREHDALLRSLAGFDNYRRRVERDRVSEARSGKRDIILRLLDVLDGFDLALAHMDGAPAS